MKRRLVKIKRVDKKAQFYLFAAIILCAAVAFAYLRGFTVQTKLADGFDEIHENFKVEQEKAVVFFIHNSTNSDDFIARYSGFVLTFKNYARTRAVNFNHVGIIKNEDKINIINNFDSDISIIYENKSQEISKTNKYEINLTEQIKINTGEMEYGFNFNKDIDFELKNLLKLEKEGDTKVYLW